MEKSGIFFALLLAASVISSLSTSETDINSQSFLTDMVSNVLKVNKPKNFVLKQAAPIDSICTL